MTRILDKSFHYTPSTAHGDPNYLRNKFRRIDPNWNKPPREPVVERPLARVKSKMKVIK